jgi:diguanylate cyclase (GGDEF)-like protein
MLFESIVRRLAVPDDPDLVQAQARALSRQVPLMYSMLLANTLILAATYLHSAPALLTAYIPSALVIVCLVRIVHWWRQRGTLQDPASARKVLQRMIWVAIFLGIGFASWSMALFPYGDTYQRSHVAFYMGITTIGCMFCLMHVRTASFVVGAVVLVPVAVFFTSTGVPVFAAIAVNMVLVVAALTVILLGNYRDFSALVASRSEMARRHAETERLSNENFRLANLDGLTGLPNRRSFLQTLEGALADAASSGRGLAVVWLDIDSFKAINDTFGHTTGNRVLVGLASRIRELNLPILTMARLEADVFVLILEGITQPAELEAAGQRLCASVREVLELPGASIHITASLGLAAARPDDTAEAILDRADYVNTVCKRESRGRAVVFAERHEREISKVRALEHALHTAELDREIYVLLQPQFDVTLDRTIGFEVLARWRSPVLGEVSPAEFIPLAERLGLVSRITRTVLRKALTVFTQLPRSIRLSVNLSAHDLSSTQAIEDIVAIVTEAGKPCRIDFEITETAVMRDIGQANAALVSLLALGSRISLDDFGTGHSSLTHVQKLPLDRIKIDRSFVSDAPHDPTSRAIVKTMLDLCRNLGIGCVFEGIETEQQLETLLALGGSVMQGYLFGRPMPPEAAIKSLQTEQARRVGAAG